MEKTKIIIYGLGNDFKVLFSEKILNALKDSYSIVGFIDKNMNFPEELELKFPCYREIINEEKFDCVCITSTKYYEDIRLGLLENSIGENKILPVEFWNDFCVKIYLHVNILKGKGVEIGGPSDVFRAIYTSECVCDGVNYNTETIWGNFSGEKYKWKNKVLGNQIIADATDLEMIENDTYDFVLSSNNLEHIANPMKAISEFLRILKKGKPLIVLVPCKEFTFDHDRDNTSFEHILHDYRSNILENDLTHLPEILDKHDLSMDTVAGSIEDFRKRGENNYINRCLHHHVFTNKLLQNIAEYFNLQVIENSVFNRNYYLVATKRD